MWKKKQENTDLSATVATKAVKKRVYRAIIHDPSGGHILTQGVNVDDDDYFHLKGRAGIYHVSPGSAWTEGGVTRVNVHPDNPQTLNAALFSDPVMTPEVYESDLENNLAVQVTSVARRKPMWQQGMAWGMGIMGLLLMGLMLWGVIALGDGFESLTEAIKTMDVQASSQAARTPAESAGHQAIAPR